MSYPPPFPPNPYRPTPAIPYSPGTKQRPKLPRREPLIGLAITLFFYLLGLFTPALILQGEGDTVWFGFRVLVIGWLGLLIGQFGWLANFPFLIGMILLLCRRWVGALLCAVLALLLALNTFLLYRQNIPVDEAATRYQNLDHLSYGFYLWLLSILALGVGALVLRKRERAIPYSPRQAYDPRHPRL